MVVRVTGRKQFKYDINTAIHRLQTYDGTYIQCYESCYYPQMSMKRRMTDVQHHGLHGVYIVESIGL